MAPIEGTYISVPKLYHALGLEAKWLLCIHSHLYTLFAHLVKYLVCASVIEACVWSLGCVWLRESNSSHEIDSLDLPSHLPCSLFSSHALPIVCVGAATVSRRLQVSW